MAKELITGDRQIKALKPGAQRLNDGKGLYLLPFVKGGSHGWRFDYTFEATRKTLSLGTYPSIGLQAAREIAASLREMVARGTNPSAVRKAAEQQAKHRAALKKLERQGGEIIIPGSFKDVALQWLAYWKDCWARDYASATLQRLKKHVFPYLGSAALDDIKTQDVRSVLARMEDADIRDSAHRVLEICRAVFAHAASIGLSNKDFNPAKPIRLKPARSKRFAAVTDRAKLAPVLLAMDQYQGSAVAKAALQLLPLLTVRPGNLRNARWSEFDLQAGWWRIPSSRMKGDQEHKERGRDHWVPLPEQAVQVLQALRPMTGNGEFVFPNQRSSAHPMSENTINSALRTLGFSSDVVTGHGFRTTGRTILDEVFNIDTNLLEVQLAHKVPGPLADIYARVEYKEFRFFVMQMWADYLDALREGPRAAEAFVAARRARFGPRRLVIDTWRGLSGSAASFAVAQPLFRINLSNATSAGWGVPNVHANNPVPKLPTTPAPFAPNSGLNQGLFGPGSALTQ